MARTCPSASTSGAGVLWSRICAGITNSAPPPSFQNLTGTESGGKPTPTTRRLSDGGRECRISLVVWVFVSKNAEAAIPMPRDTARIRSWTRFPVKLSLPANLASTGFLSGNARTSSRRSSWTCNWTVVHCRDSVFFRPGTKNPFYEESRNECGSQKCKQSNQTTRACGRQAPLQGDGRILRTSSFVWLAVAAPSLEKRMKKTAKIHVIPNNDSGWRIVTPVRACFGGEITSLEELPVVAWQIPIALGPLDLDFDPWARAIPITVTQYAQYGHCVLKAPDGKYIEPGFSGGLERSDVERLFNESENVPRYERRLPFSPPKCHQSTKDKLMHRQTGGRSAGKPGRTQ
jgi:hypothetical protein